MMQWASQHIVSTGCWDERQPWGENNAKRYLLAVYIALAIAGGELDPSHSFLDAGSTLVISGNAWKMVCSVSVMQCISLYLMGKSSQGALLAAVLSCPQKVKPWCAFSTRQKRIKFRVGELETMDLVHLVDDADNQVLSRLETRNAPKKAVIIVQNFSHD